MIIPVEIRIIVNPSYIDLSTGSLIAQILIAGGIGGLVMFRKMIWRKMKRVFRWKRKK